MQSFSFKTAKLTSRVTVEVDRRWMRATTGKTASRAQVHIDFNLVESIHYWVTQSRGAALTGHLVVRDRQGRKLALQCSGFGMDNDFVEFLRAASAALAAIGEARPELLAVPEATPFHRGLMAGLVMAGVIVFGGVYYGVTQNRTWETVGGAILGALIAAGVVLFRFGPLRKKAQPMRCADLARQIGVQVL